MAQNGQEIVFEGWLTKSPPTKRIWRARWRRRWFSLSHSGELPGQFVLSYYTDRNRRKQKGVIDLDHCEQVDLGLKLDERKLKFDHVFDIKTPTRTYYLAADTESEMKSWVNCICKVCNLKATSDEDESHMSITASDDVEVTEEESHNRDGQKSSDKSIPISPVSTSPYIPISECITGSSPVINPQDLKTLLTYNMKNSFFRSQAQSNDTYELPQRNYINYVNEVQDPRFYDCPRPLIPHNHQKTEHEKDDPHSPADCDSDSVFADDEDYEHNVSSDLNTSKKSRPSDSSADVDMTVTQKFTRTNFNQDKSSDAAPKAPPRPPKPSNIAAQSVSYLNLSSPPMKKEKDIKESSDSDPRICRKLSDSKKITTDDMYDFPRSHQVETESIKNTLGRRHCYNNAAPGTMEGHVFVYDSSPKSTTGVTPAFRYDAEDISRIERSSPLSEHNSTPAYSNLPSPLLAETPLMPPPAVNRDLKPSRKLSDSHSVYANAEPPSPRSAQLNTQKKVKSSTPLQDGALRKAFNVDEESRKMRPNPSPTLTGRSHDNLLNSTDSEEQIYHFLPGGGGSSLLKMQYLDLNFDEDGNKESRNSGVIRSRSPMRGTEYKEVDFMKTQAFNITRNNLEKERNEPVIFSKRGNEK